ncbi:hypothetical protein RUM44_008511 [Polyplax serrata]|uniref:Atrial natriuretic peptide-converting enzyme n=1 Tax=Polyplax serrata TaxID=468196 RepID=A0ABR1B8I7_POLSC
MIWELNKLKLFNGADTFILSQSIDERIFRVNFRVTEGDYYESKLADPSTEDFRVRARNYRERLNLIFRRSFLRPAFLKTDILALDGNEGEDLVVHFNAHFDAGRMDITPSDIEDILTKEIRLEKSLYLTNLTIPVESILIRESTADMTTNYPMSTATTPASTTTRRPPRQCTRLQLDYCSKMSYNVTSYPNIIGHANYQEVLDDVIAFREIVDAECYRLAYEFVCLVLQPPCERETTAEEDSMVMPCRSYCNEFIKNCGNRISPKFKQALDCSKFDEFSGSGICIPKPGCIEELQSQGLESRLCDGVIDCADMSDELSCSYCQEGYLHCGMSRTCIPQEKKCDGVVDCPNGSDERNCLAVLPSSPKSRNSINTPHLHRYYDAGLATYNRQGKLNKMCVDNLNVTDAAEEVEEVQQLADFLCQSASYKKSDYYKIEKDKETDSLGYVEMVDENKFEPSNCEDKNILHVNCKDLQCGVQVMHSKPVEGLQKMASHGDWPWHVALLKDNVHLCDGTLLSEDWILTTASCFQGQSKALWVARLGSVRLSSSSPWEQERQIVGMMKSPVEGSTLVLLKLNEPAIFSDFVRPVCLPETFVPLENYTYCTTLGWNRNREQLQRVDIKMSEMALCENISITTVNSVCAESYPNERDCDEEEFAGSSLLCLPPEGRQWHLIGVTNWRIACQKMATERPRLYDKTTSNLEWITDTLANG